MTTTPTVLTPPAPFIQTPGTGSVSDIIGSNLMTLAVVAFATLISGVNGFISNNAKEAEILANYQNQVNQSVPDQIAAMQHRLGIDKILAEYNNATNQGKTYNPTGPEIATLNQGSTQTNVIMSEAQSGTQSVATTLTGSTSAISALQQSLQEFLTEAGTTVDTTLPQQRIQ